MNPPPEPAVRAAWVHQRLREKGTSSAQLAKDNSVTPQALSNALRWPNERLEQVIADGCGVTAEWLFYPDRFDEFGTRLCQTRPLNRIPRRVAAHVQTASVA